MPIQPQYHRLLFPEGEDSSQLSMWPNEDQPFGNALKKAYLSHANVRSMRPGDTLLFYRSHDVRGLTAVGVLERTLVSPEAEEVARYVGRRTVYPMDEIQRMAHRGEILAMLFRQARLLDKPIMFNELRAAGTLRGAPQSIMRVRPEGVPWLQERLESH